jgi:uncharacterized membrane protein
MPIWSRDAGGRIGAASNSGATMLIFLVSLIAVAVSAVLTFFGLNLAQSSHAESEAVDDYRVQRDIAAARDRKEWAL